MRSRHKTSPCTALAAILSCATTTRAQNTGHARCARRQRGCRLAKSPATPLRTPGCQVGDPTLHPLTLRLAARRGARRRTSRAFALDQRPVTNSITASPARPRARKSMPRLANSKASSVLTFRPVHSGDEGELWASAKLDEDMHDGRAGRVEGGGSGRARRIPKERRCRWPVEQRAGRAGQGRACWPSR